MSSSAPARRLTHILASALQARQHWRVLLGLLMLIVCGLAFSPMPPRELDTGWDKLNHMLAFLALTVSARLGFPAPRHPMAAVLAVLLAFGGVIEVVQLFVPGRSCEWQDLLADASGITLGALLAVLLRRLAGLQR